MKRCCTCKTEKPESEFSRNKTKSDGLRSQCKACVRACFEANRERVLEQQRAYRKANREKIAEKDRAYREANRDQIAERKRAYFEANREKRTANWKKSTERMRAYMQNCVDSLSDVYVKKLIAETLKTSASQVPPELVELKRQQLAMHRAVEELGGAIAKTRGRA